MNFNDSVNSFCEGNVLGVPEYLNAFSSLYMTYVSILILTRIKLDIEIRRIYFILSLTGIFSFLFHWNITMGYKLFDEIPMILCIWFGIHFLLKLTSCPSYAMHMISVLNLFTIVLNSFKFFQPLFPVIFGSECLLLVYFYKIMIKKLGAYDKYNFGIRGVTISILSGIIWICTESFCKLVNGNWKYLFIFGHATWHIGISYGLHEYLQFVNSYILYNSHASEYKICSINGIRFLKENYICNI